MIYTGPLSKFEYVMETHRPSHVISLLSPDMMIAPDRRLSEQNHLRLSLNDINSQKEGFVTPASEHISGIIGFIEKWSHEFQTRESPLFIHCYAGISRSPAATYIAMCHLNEQLDEFKLARLMRSINPAVTPNMMMIKLADELLDRHGRMVSAIEKIGRGADAWEGDVFTLPNFFPKPAGEMECDHEPLKD